MHWSSVVRDVPIRQLLQNLVAPAIAAFSALSFRNAVLAMAALLLVGFVYRVLAWRRRRLSLTDGVLTDRRGVLTRKERQMAVARLQQVELERGPVDRLLGVAHVRMEAAADAGSTEIDLRAVPLDLARQLAQLRRVTAGSEGEGSLAEADPSVTGHAADDATGPGPEVLARGTPAAHEEGAADTGTGPSGLAGVLASPDVGELPGEPIYAPTLGEVALSAATGRRLGALPLAVFALLQFTDEVDLDIVDLVGSTPTIETTALTVTLLVVGGLVASLLVAVTAAVVLGLLRDGNMEVRRAEDRLHVRRGLLTIRSATINLRRVQVVKVNRNWLRDRLGFASVELLTSAMPSPDSQGDLGERRVALPHVPHDEVERLLAATVEVVAHPPPLEQHPTRARGRLIRRTVGWMLVLASPAVAVLLALGNRPAALAVVAVAVLAGWVTGRRSFQLQGLGSDERMVAAASGLLARDELRIPVTRVQSAWVRSQPLQRRADLVTLKVAPAGGGIGVDLTATDVDPDDVLPLVARLTSMAPTTPA